MTVAHVKYSRIVIQASLQVSVRVCAADCVRCSCIHTGDCVYVQGRLTIQILYAAIMFHFVISKC